jgi:hypothetical protein
MGPVERRQMLFLDPSAKLLHETLGELPLRLDRRPKLSGRGGETGREVRQVVNA